MEEKKQQVAGVEAGWDQKMSHTWRKCATTSQKLGFGGRISRSGPISAFIVQA
jgi:hypothetical protein